MKFSNLLAFAILFSLMSCRGTSPTAVTSPQQNATTPQVQSEIQKKELSAEGPSNHSSQSPDSAAQVITNAPAPAAAESTASAASIHPMNEVKPLTHSVEVPVAPAHKEHGAVMMTGTDPETALRWLKNGNRRFVKALFRNDGATGKDVKRLADGQKPHSIVLSCSDSRVPPEIVFDQKLGEIFTVRTAGEVVEPGTIGTIEYAIEHLGVRNLVVLGHTNCGAVKAAFSTLGGKDAGSENLNHLVQDIHPRISKFKDRAPSRNYVDEGWANVNGVVKDLMARSKILEAKIKSGEVKINSGLYDLETGVVNFN